MDAIDLGLGDYMKFMLALIFVLALIGMATVLARRFGLGMPIYKKSTAERRLAIVESLNIDGKRRLVLIRRDDTEHLLLLGTSDDLLIERAIKPPANAFSKSLRAAAKAAENPTGNAAELTLEDPQ